MAEKRNIRGNTIKPRQILDCERVEAQEFVGEMTIGVVEDLEWQDGEVGYVLTADENGELHWTEVEVPDETDPTFIEGGYDEVYREIEDSGQVDSNSTKTVEFDVIGPITDGFRYHMTENTGVDIYLVVTDEQRDITLVDEFEEFENISGEITFDSTNHLHVLAEWDNSSSNDRPISWDFEPHIQALPEHSHDIGGD